MKESSFGWVAVSGSEQPSNRVRKIAFGWVAERSKATVCKSLFEPFEFSEEEPKKPPFSDEK